MSASIAIAASNGSFGAALPEDEVELAESTSSAQLFPYKPAGLHTLQKPIELVREPLLAMLEQQGLRRARIGLQLDHGMQPSSYVAEHEFRSSLLDLMRRLLPEATFEACDDLLEEMKSVKTARELELMHRASELAAVGFAAAKRSIQAGVCETDVAAAAQSAFETAPLGASFQRSMGFFFCMSGPNSALAAAAYARTRQRVIEEGDLVMIHANTCSDGYWTDLTRTYVAGASSARQRDLGSAIEEARTAGLAAIRPGVTGREVDQATRAVMESHGLGKAFLHSAGHGVGFAAASPNARPRIHPLSPDVLETGMTFNLEPAAYFKGYGGMRHCDVVVVTRDGARVLSDF